MQKLQINNHKLNNKFHIDQNSQKYIIPTLENNAKMQKKSQKEFQWKRKQQPLILFILCLVATIYTTAQIGLLLTLKLQMIQNYRIIIATSVVRIFIFVINSYYISGIQGIIYAYTILDILGVLANCVSLMLFNFQSTYSIFFNLNGTPQFIVSSMLIFLLYICYVGNFRLMIRTCIWVRWKVLIMKFVLYSLSFFYVAYGIYYQNTFISYSDICTPCNPKSANCQQSCQKFTDCCYDLENQYLKASDQVKSDFLLFLSSALSYTSQLVAYMSDYDGTSDMEIHYTLGIDEDSQDEEQHKVIIPQDSILKQQKQQSLQPKQQIQTKLQRRRKYDEGIRFKMNERYQRYINSFNQYFNQ